MNGQVSLREVAVVYGAVLLVPVLLWLVANPVLAVGVCVLVAAMYAMVRVGMRVARRLVRGRTA